MDILIISQYLRNIELLDGNNSRFIYLANMLSENKDNSVEIVTSDFMHGPKRHAEKIDQPENFVITALSEPGYNKNISLKRFYSHKVLSLNLKKYLKKRKKPDCIYCAVPSLDVAKVAAKYCKQKGVRFIVDIQDLWPEAFKMVFNVPVLKDIVFAPMKYQADSIYRQADEVVAVSQTYVDRALNVNRKCNKGTVVFLGTNMNDFDSYVSAIDESMTKPTDEFWVSYCGSLSKSYDIDCVITAINDLYKQGYSNVRFIVMGDGSLKNKFETYAINSNIKYVFTGMLPYPKMVKILSMCDIAVNPIRKGSAGSVINKVGDYAMAGLPVVNTQECVEYRQLLIQYNAGINCDDVTEVMEAIKKLIDDKNIRNEMKEGSRNLGIDRFDRGNTYRALTYGLFRVK